MAWVNNNVQRPAEDTRSSAVDWEAKRIPRLAYENCLQAKEVYLSSLKGNMDEHRTVAKNRFVVSITIFFDTVETEFVKWLNLPTRANEDGKKVKIRRSIQFDKKEITAEDYFVLLGDTRDINEKKLFLLFQVLKNWCFEYGSLNTFADLDNDVFERLEVEE